MKHVCMNFNVYVCLSREVTLLIFLKVLVYMVHFGHYVNTLMYLCSLYN